MTDARDAVQAQYEAWVYPSPIPDIAEAMATGFYAADDPALVRRKLWPRNVEPDALEILVAGCGSSQAAIYAFTNPDCHVVGIDISESSLDHQRHLKAKHQLDNLDLRQLPVENADDLKQSFDFVSSTGVLHHLPDPDLGLRSLRGVLAPHGVMSLMLYGRYGRAGIYMLQEAMRLLGARQDADGLDLVRSVLETIPSWHAAQRYLETSLDASYDAGLVDTFLHTVDRAYSVPEVLQFASDNGLKFQSWLDNLDYSISARIPTGDELGQRAQALPRPEQWQLFELLWQSPGTHRFLLCHVDRAPSDYAIDFSGDAWVDYVPSFRPPLQITVSQEFRSPSIGDGPQSAAVGIERNSHHVELDAFGIAALDLIDGATPIRHLLERTAELTTTPAAQSFFQQMADWDHFLFEIP
jgi:SAM-dependent methyltransferase